jgi:precorrin-3B C17-methyltransferase
MARTSIELCNPSPVKFVTPPTIASRSSARVMPLSWPPKAGRSRSFFEAVEGGDPAWRELDIRVEPGVTAMLAAAAEVGAPLGADFCAISLSDNLKSWETIERRLRTAAEGDFVIALYNPASKARSSQLGRAFDLLRATKSPETIVLFVRAAATSETRVVMTTLAKADSALADMRTLVIIGASATRTISRNGGAPWVYTPRAEQETAR